MDRSVKVEVAPFLLLFTSNVKRSAALPASTVAEVRSAYDTELRTSSTGRPAASRSATRPTV